MLEIINCFQHWQPITSLRVWCWNGNYDYVLPLESERAHKAYGVPGSAVNKLLTINAEVNPQRLTVIIVKEHLGF